MGQAILIIAALGLVPQETAVEDRVDVIEYCTSGDPDYPLYEIWFWRYGSLIATRRWGEKMPISCPLEFDDYGTIRRVKAYGAIWTDRRPFRMDVPWDLYWRGLHPNRIKEVK